MCLKNRENELLSDVQCGFFLYSRTCVNSNDLLIHPLYFPFSKNKRKPTGPLFGRECLQGFPAFDIWPTTSYSGANTPGFTWSDRRHSQPAALGFQIWTTQGLVWRLSLTSLLYFSLISFLKTFWARYKPWRCWICTFLSQVIKQHRYIRISGYVIGWYEIVLVLKNTVQKTIYNYYYIYLRYTSLC